MHQSGSPFRSFFRAAAVAALVVAAPALEAGAQLAYPAFQPPRTIAREYNFAVADADWGTTLLFQWREGWSPISQLGLDAGIVDVEGSDVHLLVGGNYARQLARASNDLPLDLLLTVGANALVGDHFRLDIPVGISLGHRFPLEGGLAITPYLHPRVGLEYVNVNDHSDTDLGGAFDLGVDFEVSPRLSIRGTFMFGSDDRDAIGIGLAWRPQGLRR
jgi:hypothetical protein